MEMSYREKIYSKYMSVLFSELHADVEKDFAIHSRYFKRNYLKFLPPAKDCRIIDVGCGMGHFLNFALQEGYQNIVGVDISEENVNFCTAHGYNVIKNDAANYLRNHVNAFDAIIFNDVIENLHKNEILDILLAMKDSLKPGGVLLIKTDNMANPFTASAGRFIDFTREIGFTETSLKQVLMTVGFDRVAVIGTDIYIFGGPVNFIAKYAAKAICWLLYMLSYLFGRKSLTIYEKALLAVARK